MATYGSIYEFALTSSNGADILIVISKKFYDGKTTRRPLGRAPILKRENSGRVFGTSLEIYAECAVDGEYAQFYTSSADEFKVEVYKNDIRIWSGFISPELYSEPDIAPPYDVQIIATDGLGELKDYTSMREGITTLREHFNRLLQHTGLSLDFRFASSLEYACDNYIYQPYELCDLSIDLTHDADESCYEELQKLLTFLNAGITQFGDRWLIFRETDLINLAQGQTLQVFGSDGTYDYLNIASFGSSKSCPWWPIGQLSSVIKPAKNSLKLSAPNHYKDNVLTGLWEQFDGAVYDNSEGAYNLPVRGSSVKQSIDFSDSIDYRLMLRIKARNVGHGGLDQSLAVQVKMHGISGLIPGEAEEKDYYLWFPGTSDRGPASYTWTTDVKWITPSLAIPEASDTSSDAQDIEIVLPFYYSNYYDRAIARNIEITVQNPSGWHAIYVYDVALYKYDQFAGYEANVKINNGAREEASDVDLTVTNGHDIPVVGSMFMTGIPLIPGNTNKPIDSWRIHASEFREYLSTMALDYSRSMALPRMEYKGILNVPAGGLPVLFLRDNTYYFPQTYSYDLYNDELEVSLISVPAAEVEIGSIQISELTGNRGSSGSTGSSNGAGGGSTGGGFGGGGQIVDTEMSDNSSNVVGNNVIKAYVDDQIATVVSRIVEAEKITKKFGYDDDGLFTHYNFRSYKQIAVGEVGSPDGGGSGSGVMLLESWSDVPSSLSGYALSAALGIDLHERFNNYYTIGDVDSRFYGINSRLATLDSGMADRYTKAESDGRYLKTDGSNKMSAAIRWNDGHEGNEVADWDAVATETGLRIISSTSTTTHAPTTYATALHVKGRYGFQLASEGGAHDNFWIRNVRDKRAWKKLAFTDTNVDSAQALKNSNGTVGATAESSGIVSFASHIVPNNDSQAYVGVANKAWYAVYTNGLWAPSGKTLYLGANNSNHIIVNTSGNVLIGTTNDNGAKLQVNGGISTYNASSYFAGYGSSNATSISELNFVTAIGAGKDNWNIYMWSLGNGKGCIQSCQSDGTTVYDLLLQPFAGNVGIGTKSPAYKLDVEGTIRANGDILPKWGNAYSIGSNFLRWKIWGEYGSFSEAVEMLSTLTVNGATTVSSTLSVASTSTFSGLTTHNSGISTPHITIGGITISVVDGVLRIDGNVYTTGQLGVGAVGQEGGGTGGGGVLLLNTWPTDGGSYAGYALGGNLGIDLNTRVKTLEGKATAVSFSQTLTSGKQIGVLTIDGSSDVLYAPSTYAWNEITSRPSKLSDFTDDVVAGKYLPLTGGTMKKGSTRNYLFLDTDSADGAPYITFQQSGSNRVYIGHSASAGAFIQEGSGGTSILTLKDGVAKVGENDIITSAGGTIKRDNVRNPLAIDTSDSTGAYLVFRANGSNASFVGYDSSLGALLQNVPTSTRLYVGAHKVYLDWGGSNVYTILHTGNANKADVPWTASNILFPTGTSATWNIHSTNAYKGITVLNAVQAKPEGAPDHYAVGLSVSGYYGFTLASLGAGDVLLYRRKNETDWKTIAFTDSNVASATKLATARTIWGQSFDGTGDVSGSLTGTNFLIMDRASNPYLKFTENGKNGFVQFLEGIIAIGPTSTKSLLVNYNGNVTIGGSDLAGTSAKLYVDGTARISGAATLSSTLSVNGLVTASSGIKIGSILLTDENGTLKIAGNAYTTGQLATGEAGQATSGDGSVVLDYDSIVDALGFTPAKQNDLSSLTSRVLALESAGPSSSSSSLYGDEITIGSSMGNIYISSENDVQIDSIMGSVLVNGSDVLTKANTSFTRNYTSGTKIGTIKIGGTSTDIYAPASGSSSLWITEHEWENDIDIIVSAKEYIGTNSIVGWDLASTSMSDLYIGFDGYTIWMQGSVDEASDMRLKTVIDAVNLDIRDIAFAPIFNYVFKSRPQGRQMLGSSAQYWQPITPSAVSENDKGNLAMNYGAIALASVVAVAKETLTQRGEIANLKLKVQSLESRLARYELN